MRAKFQGVLSLAVLLGLALPVTGQVAPRRAGTATMQNPAPAHLPYTAEFKVTHVRTLANGTTITTESTEVVTMDSQGRRMTARTTTPTGASQSSRTFVSVFDPVAHNNTNWSVPGQRATVMAMPTPGAPRSGCASNATVTTSSGGGGGIGSVMTTVNGGIVTSQSGTQAPQRHTVEELGTQTIFGIEARGRRMTTTTPAGEIGNDAPLVRTSETWNAMTPGLYGLIVRSLMDDPQNGTSTRELVNFSQSEPDPASFQPPAGYEIVNQEMPQVTCASTPAVAPLPAPPPPAD